MTRDGPEVRRVGAMMAQLVVMAASIDPRMQGDPDGDRDFGMMFVLFAVLGIGALLVFWVFDRVRDRRPRHTGGGAVLARQFRQTDEDELTQLMREW